MGHVGKKPDIDLQVEYTINLVKYSLRVNTDIQLGLEGVKSGNTMEENFLGDRESGVTSNCSKDLGYN